MRRSWWLAAICTCVAGVSGCGAGDAAEDAANEAKKAVDPVAEAAEKTAASGGARMIGDVKMRYAGTPITMTINGEISFEDSRLRMRMNLGQIKGVPAADMVAARREAQMPMDFVQTPDEIFLSTAKVREKGKKDGIEWIRLDLEELDEETGRPLRGHDRPPPLPGAGP